MQIYCFDIETIPNQTLPPGVTPEFDPTTVKHGNTKDPAKRTAKEATERAKFNNALTKKMSLDPDLCEVISFCGSVYNTETGEHQDTIISGDEASVRGAWDFITEGTRVYSQLVSFNGIGFDLKVLRARAIDLDIHYPSRIYSEITRRFSVEYHYDLMQVLSDWDRQSWKGLDFYLKRYGIGQKTGSGGDVFKMYQEGRIKEIEEYCLQDVLLTARLFARVEPWIVQGKGTEDF
jgi:hypothetical protein